MIEVRLKQAPTVVIEDVQADLYVAIDRAAERAARAMTRRLARHRHFAPLPMETWMDEVQKHAAPGQP
jgi:ribosome-associated translation inhibitor RaiA